ncbi:MAG TPA: CoA ester lyase [Candidatus Dormibacteraeota bacterium]|nr:CoA ester lyase [Candidatus Dormibacteraeota bacterium]
MSQAPRAHRSCLSVPGSQPRFHERADTVPADMVMFDLEDSVAPSAKAAARGLVVRALCAHAYTGKVRGVRVNAVDTGWCLDDVREVVEGAGDRIDVIVLPKVEDVDQVHFLHHLLQQLERRIGLQRRIGLELQIESARGLEQVSNIAGASDRNQALIFGPGDLGASLRMPGLTIGALQPDYPGDLWHYARVRMLIAARAHGLQAIDGPYAQIRDLEGLRASARQVALLGYDGKWVVHPAQVEVVNEIFTPSQEEFDRASAIVEAYQRASDQEGTGALMLGEEMVDEASRRLAETLVERGRAVGMTPRDRSADPTG